ncbi:hypothetical protein GJ744_005365 [Endocarpon pusillum]|uniref:Chitin synthesis regulation, Congo red resistance, RCR protein n=1 Tax=Endocarpon pusillum TaxID=364733 RepID=A0A8H7E5F2_9EURO|nr:hypothetical protein GJ744_005365 [Endocarpon pusillum]
MARCYDRYNRVYNCDRAWYSWGRWVLFAVIVISSILFFFFFSCLSARRRRKRGLQPFYGTGWVGNTPAGHGAATYNPQYQNQTQQQPQYGNQSAPAYDQGQEGGYYNQTQGGTGANQGYYGGQQTGATELQPPPNAYRAGDQVYEPPAGPPPGKDGIVR